MPEPTLSALITSAEEGDRAASEALFATLYAELRRMAARELARQGGNQPISATTLLHEAYLAMSNREGVVFPDRARFMAYACRVMRGLIIDHARRRQAARRGGLVQIVSDTAALAGAATPAEAPDLERMSEALDELSSVDAALAQVVDLKFFCGFTFAEIAAMRGVSERTVQREWEKARLYLHRVLDQGTGGSGEPGFGA